MDQLERKTDPRFPGWLLAHPIPVLAVGVVLVNDRVVKPRWPGVLSGKLSDVAGVFFLPLLIASVIELARKTMGRPRAVSLLGVAVASAFVAIGFATVKLWTPASGAYGSLVGLLRWPVTGSRHHVVVATDPSDLIALPFALLAWVYAATRSKRIGSR